MNRKLFTSIGLLLIGAFVFAAPCFAQGYRYPPCYSIRESKMRGCYLYSLTFEPNVFTWKGKEIKIKEAWFEQAHERFLIGSKKASHYNMCVNLSTGWDVLWETTGPSFAIEGNGGLGMMGSAVLYKPFDKIESDEFNLVLAEFRKTDGAIKIKVKATKPGSAKNK